MSARIEHWRSETWCASYRQAGMKVGKVLKTVMSGRSGSMKDSESMTTLLVFSSLQENSGAKLQYQKDPMCGEDAAVIGWATFVLRILMPVFRLRR